MSDSADELDEWLARVTGPEWVWHVKYISANDTYAKPNVHQGGPYVGKELLRLAFPQLSVRADRDSNPNLMLSVAVRSHNLLQDVRLVWYNSRRLEHRQSGRDEARLTQWGGKEHPLVAEDTTGSLVAFAFHAPKADADADGCEVWISRSHEQEDRILDAVGPVEPGSGIVFQGSTGQLVRKVRADLPCSLQASELLPEWLAAFPSGDDILEMALQRLPSSGTLAPDARLLKRRDCEYSLFLSIESHVAMPRVAAGFRTVEEFVAFANSVTNRRKSRAGKSLELQARVIFREESVEHSWGPMTEGNRRPDFIFPSIGAYHEAKRPSERLRMLAAKTTCKDRWRQILNEAERIPVKHLLTLQEGVSEPQYREMKDEGVRLVVPTALHRAYPDSVQPELLSLEQFVGEAKAIA